MRLSSVPMTGADTMTARNAREVRRARSQDARPRPDRFARQFSVAMAHRRRQAGQEAAEV